MRRSWKSSGTSTIIIRLMPWRAHRWTKEYIHSRNRTGSPAVVMRSTRLSMTIRLAPVFFMRSRSSYTHWSMYMSTRLVLRTFTPGSPVDQPKPDAIRASWLGVSWKVATMPGCPVWAPWKMKWRPMSVLPTPAGPQTSVEEPAQ
jgi:hypothetical protein